jgi:hypothetical protein
MQIKSAAAGLRMAEVPVIYRQRIGRSKITRTTHGSLYAGTRILIIMARSALLPERATRKTCPVQCPIRSELLHAIPWPLRVINASDTRCESRRLPRRRQGLHALPHRIEGSDTVARRSLCAELAAACDLQIIFII